MGNEPIENVKIFFESFTANGHPRPQGEFETMEEYKKRLPPPHDSSKVIYLKVSNISSLLQNYKYDIDNEKLTAFAGHLCKDPHPPLVYPGADKGTRIIILSDMVDKGTYEASNSYGATVTVQKSWVFEYVLNFSKLDSCPADLYDSARGRFQVTISRPPKVAEMVSKHLEIIIGVKLPNYQQSSGGAVIDHFKPTIDQPSDFTTFLFQADAKLVKVMLRDSSSEEILAEYDIPPKTPPSSQ